MSRKSFTKDWLSVAKITDDPEGDLIADMKRDKDIPHLFANIRAMQTYLIVRQASPEALAAVPRVWRRYKQWLDRHPWGL